MQENLEGSGCVHYLDCGDGFPCACVFILCLAAV